MPLPSPEQVERMTANDVLDVIAKCIADEREACAQIAEAQAERSGPDGAEAAFIIAAQIRARRP